MNFLEDIRCVFDRDPAARHVFEVITCYPGVQALMLHRVAHRLWRLRLRWLARFLSSISRWLTGVEIHPAAKIGRRFFIDHGLGVVIGETADIGDDCTLYQGVTLGGVTWEKGKRHPTLKNNVIVGAGAKILGPVIIDEGVKIGSNSVVVKSVAKNQTVVGVPGRLLKVQKKHLDNISKVASDIGFSAYAVDNPDMVDPTITTINAMLTHLRQLDQQMRIVSEKLDVCCDEKHIDLDDLTIKDK